jgi:hypothetical protein
VPTSTRSFTQLLSTEAGVNTELSPVLTNGNGNQSPSVNGTSTTSTSLFFNGIDATNNTPNEGSLNDNNTQFGLTEKSFRFRDYSAYIADDWKVSRKLTLNLGLRYELFMWPEEKQGRIGNFDFDSFQPCFGQTGGSLALCDAPSPGFLVPANVQTTGLANVDGAIAATNRAANSPTLGCRSRRWSMSAIA